MYESNPRPEWRDDVGDDTDLPFRRIVDTLPVAAYACDAQGLITYYNDQAVELWGRAPALEDPRDRYCGSFRLFDADDGTAIPHDDGWMARALAGGKGYTGREIIIERPDGDRRRVVAHATPFHDASGCLAGAVTVLVDVTRRRRVEAELRQAERRKSEFLATLAHELRNPLAPLRNGLEIMRLADGDPAGVEEARAMMERQLGQMVRLIDDLLDLSRVSNGRISLRRAPIDLAAVIADAVEASRPAVNAAGHELSAMLPPHPIVVNADRARLVQVFANLLDNSTKYTEAGGHIRLTVREEEGEVTVTISDDGIGIPPEMLPRIFEMFTQVERGEPRSGLGIGLSLVQNLVEMHGGHVEAWSAGRGQGSEFIVHLPVVAAEPLPAATVDQPALGHTRHRILVVDDNEDAATSLALLLTMTGNTTRTAHDGEAAVDAAEEFRPDVILLDIGLPKRNGYEVCRRIRSQPWGKRMAIIALTGWGQAEDRRWSKDAGFDFHLVKPVDPADLERLLTGVLAVSPRS